MRALTLRWLAVVVLAAPRTLLADVTLVARVGGSDVLLADREGDPCAGDLYRGEHFDLLQGALPLHESGVSCPILVGGDGELRGTADAVYYHLATGGPDSSSVAFRMERHLDVYEGFENTYLVSLPTILGLADLANSAAAESNKCVGDADGPASPDGRLNADDLLCSWWTSRVTGQGSMMVSIRDEPTASWLERSAFVDPVTGAIEFAGTWTADLAPSYDAVMASVDGAAGTENHFLITGGHDLLPPGRVISPASDQIFLLSQPYHGMSRTANELLCGLQDIDWVDFVPWDGVPDTCPHGVFDGLHAVTVVMRDNTPDGSLTDDSYVSRTVWMAFGRLVFMGVDFEIAPGDAYVVSITADHDPTVWLPPHY